VTHYKYKCLNIQTLKNDKEKYNYFEIIHNFNLIIDH